MHEGERPRPSAEMTGMNSEMKSGVLFGADCVNAARRAEQETETCISCFIEAHTDPGTVVLITPSTFHQLPLFYSLSLSMRLFSSPSLQRHSLFFLLSRSLVLRFSKCSACPLSLSLAPYLGSVKLRCSLISVSSLCLTATFICTLSPPPSSARFYFCLPTPDLRSALC